LALIILQTGRAREMVKAFISRNVTLARRSQAIFREE
jgi:hypothetical protein